MMIGTRIGHYVIKSELGEGGMAQVYKAYDTQLKRFVAIKFLSKILLRNKDARARFLREARAASALNHPNIAVIYEIGQHEGRDYIVMEYVDGPTLGDKIDKAPLNPLELAHIARQCASALAKAHASGIIHRDIKPDNIMINKEGMVKLMDFGLAKTTQATRITPVGYALGTPAYMSPEQAKRTEVDTRSDIYTLGVVLYEALSGKLPYRGETEYSIMYAVVHKKPEPLRVMNEDVPQELADIVHVCMAKKPNHRYQSCKDLESDLSRVIEQLEKGESDRPASRALKSRRRRKIIKTVGIPTALISGVVGFALVFLHFIMPLLTSHNPRLAVLPVQDETAEKILATHNWTIAYALTTTLAQSEHVEVIPLIRLQDAFTSLGRGLDDRMDRDVLVRLSEMLGNKYFIWGLLNDSHDGYTLSARIVELPTWKWDFVELSAPNLGDIYRGIDSLTVLVRKKIEPGFSEEPVPSKSLAELTTLSMDALARFIEAERLIGQFDIGPAEVALENTVALDSTFPLANATLALTKDFRGHHDAAVHLLHRAERHLENRSTKEKDLVNLLGAWINREMQNGLKQAIEMERNYPNDERVLVNVGDIYWASDRLDDARRVYTKILHHNPWHLYSLDALASIEMQEKNWESAEIHLTKGVRVAPLVGNSHRSLGYLYFLRGNFDLAIKEFQKANLLRHGIASLLLGETYQIMGQFDKSEEYLQACLTNPFTQGEDYYAAQLLAKQKAIEHHWRAVNEIFQKLVTGHSDDPAILARLGVSYVDQGYSTKADSVLLKLLQSDSTKKWINYLRGYIYLSEGRINSAITDLQHAADAIESEDIFLAHEIRCKIAESYLQLGKAKLAFNLFQLLDEDLPRRPDVLIGLAKCYARKNQRDRAIKYYTDVLDIWQDSKIYKSRSQSIAAEINRLQHNS